MGTIGEGSRVILPLYHPGALLLLGDLQEDGEPTGNGIETSMDMEFSVAVVALNSSGKSER